MASTDLTNAYCSVPIETSSQTFFVFHFEGKCFKYASLLNDSSLPPKITKLGLFTLRKLGQNVLNCLDEIFICGDTFVESCDAVLAAASLLFKLGFFSYPENSELTPMQEI